MAERRHGDGEIENIWVDAPGPDAARRLPAHWQTVSLFGAAILAIVSLLGAVSAVTGPSVQPRVVVDVKPLSSATGPASSPAGAPPVSSPPGTPAFAP